MAELPETHLIFEKLGDINATLREVKHVTNQNSMKIDALAAIVANQGVIVDRVSTLTVEQERHNVRITTLEAKDLRREGAVNLATWLSKYWPFTFLSGIVLTVIAWANDKI